MHPDLLQYCLLCISDLFCYLAGLPCRVAVLYPKKSPPVACACRGEFTELLNAVSYRCPVSEKIAPGGMHLAGGNLRSRQLNPVSCRSLEYRAHACLRRREIPASPSSPEMNSQAAAGTGTIALGGTGPSKESGTRIWSEM